MLESDEVNLYNCHLNSLVVDRYDREDVWPLVESNKPFRNQLEIVNTIRKDIFKILNFQTGDIREFIKNCANHDEEI